MRTIDDAVEMQQYIRRRRCRTAVVIGGGLLGLEAAYSIHEMDVRTFVLDRASYPLNRQLDPVGGAIVWQKMYDLGIQVLSNSIPSRILGEERVTGVELADGRVVPADLCLVATGIAPRTELALSAGLAVNTGVVVNDELQTSDPAIYAAGDVSEHQGRIYGLWPACVEQAGVAAVNLLGGTRRYEPLVPPTQLKVPGIDLLSVGEIAANGDGHELHFEVPSTRKYRKLVLREGRVYGAILVGHPELSDAVKLAVERHRDVSAELDRLEAGDWSVLGASMPVPA
jgi:NAD(P)H-nitrite reductase large subunit